MPRTFLALNLPPELKTALSLLPGEIPGARWLDTEQYHVTLKFLGVLTHSEIDTLQECLSGVDFPVVPLKVKGVGLFPLRGDPETLWVGVDHNPALLRMQKHLEAQLSRHGFPREGRQYFPHISLARLREVGIPYLASFVAKHSTWEAEEAAITSYSLYSSHGSATGSHYVEEVRFPLYGITGDEDSEESDLD
jgi:RNA 2',3'-cyclic 3'-phosphodiesterase